MAGTKPHVTTRGPAAQYAGPTEQIIEYSVPDGNATGGLISVRWDPETGAVSVHAYRHDAAVTVTASPADGTEPDATPDAALAELIANVLARPDAAEALDYILSVPEGGPSCGCGADHWSCDWQA